LAGAAFGPRIAAHQSRAGRATIVEERTHMGKSGKKLATGKKLEKKQTLWSWGKKS
jgi:hypothetical protein